MTRAEEVLWEALRDRGLDRLKFRRQHFVGPYVLDFCCPLSWLVVEVDGDIHDDPEHQAYDSVRTDHLNTKGFRVIRFRNDEVLNELSRILQRIRDEAQWSSPPIASGNHAHEDAPLSRGRAGYPPGGGRG
jgi:5-methyltetrahydrofolate--homocysteine methyltransferase